MLEVLLGNNMVLLSVVRREKMRGRPGPHTRFKWMLVLTLIFSLLGTSYAYWNQMTVVEGKITSGYIDAKGAVKRNYTMCANINCNTDYHHESAIVKIDKVGNSLPVKIRKVEMIGFTYSAEKWKKTREWVRDWGPFGHYEDKWELLPGRETVTLNAQDLKDVMTENETIRINPDQTIEVSFNDETLKDKMPKIWTENRPSDRPARADIDVSKKGKMKIRIYYTQFNTPKSGGWVKSEDVEMDVSWYRWNNPNDQSRGNNIRYPENGNQSIEPGHEWAFSLW